MYEDWWICRKSLSLFVLFSIIVRKKLGFLPFSIAIFSRGGARWISEVSCNIYYSITPSPQCDILIPVWEMKLYKEKNSENFWKELGTQLHISLFFHRIGVAYRIHKHEQQWLLSCGLWNWKNETGLGWLKLVHTFLMLSRRAVLWCLRLESCLLYFIFFPDFFIGSYFLSVHM